MNKPASGFTLIELAVAVIILAILVVIAVPAMSRFLNSNQLSSHTSAIRQAIQYARSEAVSKNEPVSICASADSATCNGGENFAQGWIVRVDSDGDVLRVWQEISKNFVLTGNTVTFSATGESNGVATFLVRDKAGATAEANARTVTVNNVGWVRVARGIE